MFVRSRRREVRVDQYISTASYCQYRFLTPVEPYDGDGLTEFITNF